MKYRTIQSHETLVVTDPSHNLRLKAAFASDMGRVRSNNEDSVQLWEVGQGLVGLVADGMGGAAGGEEASRLAVLAVEDDFVKHVEHSHLADLSPEALAEKMRHALLRANTDVLERANADISLQGMGTTATLVWLQGAEATFAHVGDSRAYFISPLNPNKIAQVTTDHSYVEALVQAGHLTPEQAAEHPMKNILYRALGQKPDTELEVEIYKKTLRSGDCLILCSDGLTRHVKDSEIAEIVLGQQNPVEIIQKLIARANERGGEDNISALVVIAEDNQ
jgi:protein phosphatase